MTKSRQPTPTQKSEVTETQYADAQDYIPSAPDGPWGWVIVAASLVGNIIVDGIGYSFGVFLIVFVDHFQSTKAQTAFIGSLLCGVYLCAGPLVSGLVNRFGCRPVTIAGSIFSCAAFFLSTFSPSVSILALTYGALGGFGFGLIYLPCVICCGYYFDKKRALATGIAVCGSGLGTFIFPPFIKYLLEIYDWKNTIIILAGIILNGAVCGMLMRPLPIPSPQPALKSNEQKRYFEGPIVKERLQSHDGRSNSENVKMQCTKDCNQLELSDHKEPPSAENMKRDGDNKGTTDLETEPLVPKIEVPVVEDTVSDTKTHVSQQDALLSPEQNSFKRDSQQLSISSDKSSTNGYIIVEQIGSTKSPSVLVIEEKTSRSKDRSMRSMDERMHLLTTGENYKLVVQKEDLARPLYRKDIFYSGSVLNIPQFRSQPDMRSFRSSMISIPVDFVDDETRQCGCWEYIPLPKSVKDVVQQTVDINLLMHPLFLFICVGNVFAFLGFYVPFVYIVDRAFHMGIDKGSASFLLSVIGITNTVGRIISGFLADRKELSSLVINNVALILSGAVTILAPFCTSYTTLIVYSSLFGLCISAFISLTSIILCDLFGVEKLTNAFGLITLVRGVSAITGPPLTGFIFDITGSHNLSFHIGGALIITGGLFHALAHLPCFKRYQAATYEISNIEHFTDDTTADDQTISSTTPV